MADDSVGSISFDMSADTSGLEDEVERAAEHANEAVERAVEHASDEIQRILADTESSMRSRDARIAAIYRQQGQNQSDAWRNAWNLIERSATSANESISNDTSETGREITNNASQVARKLRQIINRGASNVKSFTSTAVRNIKSMASRVKTAFTGIGMTIATVFSTVAIAAFIKSCVESAASVKALNSQFEQTFGNLENNAKQAIRTVAKESGIVESRLQGVGTSIYAFAKTTGMDSVTALNLMKEALQVTADSAAYYDKSLEETAESLKSFLKGNFENDAALGLSCTETTRNTAANKLYGKSFIELSESQKQLTLLQMVKDANQLSGAMGQASREADGWENVTGNLKEAWKQLLAVVGQPILQVATQAVKKLTSAMQTLTVYAEQASNAISKFFGWDTGKETANAISSASDNASSLADSANSSTENIKETEKAAKKLQNRLSGFDELNVLSQDDSNSSSADTPSSPTIASVTSSAIKVEEIDNTTPLDRFYGKFVTTLNKIKKLVAGGDFSGLGGMISSKFNNLLEKINWKKIQEKAKEWTTNITSFLNGSIKETDWNLVGITLGEAFNTLIISAFTFVTTFNWEEFGKSIEDSIISACKTINWGELGQTLSAGLQGVFSVLPSLGTALGAIVQGLIKTAFSFVSTFDWKQAGKDLVDAVNNFIAEIDWGMVASTLSKALLGLWDTAKSAIANFDWQNLGKSICDFIVGIDWWGLISGPFIDLWNFIFNPLSILDEGSISNTIANALWDLWCGILDGLGITEYWTNVFFSAWNGIQNAFSSVKNFFGNIWSSIKDAFSNVTNWFKNTFSEAWQAVKNVFSTGGKIFEGIKDGISSVFKRVVNSLIDGINNVISVPFSTINSALETIKNLEIAGWKPFEWITSVAVPKIPKLARGGIVKAPTLALVGDNAGASTGNPEVVAPLNKLKGMLNEGDGSVEDTAILSQILQYLIKIYEAITSDGNTNIIELIAKLDEGVLFKRMIELNKQYKKRHGGKSAFA